MIELPSLEHMRKYEKMMKSGKYTDKELEKFWNDGAFSNNGPHGELEFIKNQLGMNEKKFGNKDK